MEATYKDGSFISNEEIIGLLVGLLLAGQHTSNVTSTWMGILLLSSPEQLYANLLFEFSLSNLINIHLHN